MKFYLFFSTMIFLCTTSAFAAESYVPEKAAKSLFQALSSAFPQAKEGANHSESVFVESLYCVSNEDEYLCLGKTTHGAEITLEGGNPVLQEQEANKKLNALWQAMKLAKLPIEKGQGYSALELNYLACDHFMPGSGKDSYECGYTK